MRDTQPDATCPTCGRSDFASERSMKIHHTKTHGESIAEVESECAGCGAVFSHTPSEDRTYCSRSCFHDAHAERMSGEGNPSYSGGKRPAVCANCDADITVFPAHDRDHENHFCDRDCWVAYQRREQIETTCSNCGSEVRVSPSGQDLANHYCDRTCMREHWTTLQTVACATCGSEIERQRSATDRYKNHFCSRDCQAEFKEQPIDRACSTCGEAVVRTPSSNHDDVFCSRACFGEYNTGAQHPNWNSLDVQCWWCGAELTRPAHRVARSEKGRQFCDRDCHGRWKSWSGVSPDDPDPDKDMPRHEWPRYHSDEPPAPDD